MRSGRRGLMRRQLVLVVLVCLERVCRTYHSDALLPCLALPSFAMLDSDALIAGKVAQMEGKEGAPSDSGSTPYILQARVSVTYR